MTLKKQAEKGVTILTGENEPDYQEGIELLLSNGGKEEYTWNAGDPLENPLFITMPCFQSEWETKQPNPESLTNGPVRNGGICHLSRERTKIC